MSSIVIMSIQIQSTKMMSLKHFTKIKVQNKYLTLIVGIDFVTLNVMNLNLKNKIF
jgi:hypothetical protein